MLIRFFIAIALGLLIGVVLYEGLLALLALLLPGGSIVKPMLEDGSLSLGKAVILVCSWTLGASASALVAAGLARNRWAGALAAACWILPMSLLIGLAHQPAIRLSLALSIATLAALISLRFSSLDPAKTRSRITRQSDGLRYNSLPAGEHSQ